MPHITKKQEFLTFATRHHFESKGWMPSEEDLNVWGGMYDRHLQNLRVKRTWKENIAAFMRFLLAGFIVTIPVFIILSVLFIFVDYSPLRLLIFSVITLQLTYVAIAMDWISGFVFRGLPKKKA